VGLYVAYFRQQNYQRKLISSTHELVKTRDPDWAIVSQGHRIQDVGGLTLPMQATELRSAGSASLGSSPLVGDRLNVWRIYWINGRPMISDWQAKVYGAVYRLMGRGDDAAVLVFYADKAGGDKQLAAFVRDNWSSLDAWLRSTREAVRTGKVIPAAAAMPASAASKS
jgi:EpsI family protein